MFNIHSMKKIMRRLKKKSKNPKKNSSKVLTNQHILVRITRVIRTFFSQFWRKSCIIFKIHENVKKNTSDLNFSVIFQITFQPDSALEIRSPSFTKGTVSPSWKWDEGDDEGVPFVPFVYTSLCIRPMKILNGLWKNVKKMFRKNIPPLDRDLGGVCKYITSLTGIYPTWV